MKETDSTNIISGLKEQAILVSIFLIEGVNSLGEQDACDELDDPGIIYSVNCQARLNPRPFRNMFHTRFGQILLHVLN